VIEMDSGTTPRPIASAETPPIAGEVCEVCGVAAVVERKCKVICLNCHTILKSCADL
jgi:hypothetical protein